MLVKTQAKKLYDDGFTVIPVRYKVPIQSKWEQGRVEPNGNYDAANGTGIVLGTPIDGGYLAALDVDCYNKDVSREFYVWLSERYGEIPYRVGTKPKFLIPFICTNEQCTKSASKFWDGTSRIELLGLGQQFVSHGSPSEGINYRWFNGEMNVASLPRWTTGEVHLMIGVWEQMAQAAGMSPGEVAADPFGMGSTPDDFLAGVDMGPVDLSDSEIIATLTRYKATGLDYDNWLEVGMALHHQYDGSKVGLNIWVRWSERSDKHDPSHMHRRWTSFQRDGGPSKTFRTIIKKARTAGDFKAAEPREADPQTEVEPWLIKRLDACLEDSKPPSWLIKGLFQRNDTIALFGPSGSGKSFVALDQALHIAHGISYQGLKTHQGRVVYFCGEGYSGFLNRCKAWHQHHGLEPSENLYVVRGTPQIGEGFGGEVIRRYVSEMLAIKPAMVIIDTLARAATGLDENSAADMGQAVTLLDGLKAKVNCALVIVHHTGLQDTGRMRGSSALKAAMDVEMGVVKSEDMVTLSNHKMKDSEPFPPVTFRLQGVNFVNADGEVLVDDDGDTFGSAVIMPNSADDDDNIGGDSGLPPRPTDDHSLLLMKVLTEMKQLGHEVVITDDHLVELLGIDAPAEGFNRSAVREEFNRQSTTDNITTRRQQFKRAIARWIKAGVIAHRDDVIYVLRRG